MVTEMNLYVLILTVLIGLLLGGLVTLACMADRALVLREEDRKERRLLARAKAEAECAVSELIARKLAYVLAQQPETWTARDIDWLRLAFTRQHPHAVQGLQHAHVLKHDAAWVALCCAPESYSALGDAWLWYVDRETGNFFQEA